MYEEALNYAFAETEKSNNVIRLRNKYEKKTKIIEQTIENFACSGNAELTMAVHTYKRELEEVKIIAEALKLLEDKRWNERSGEK